MSQSTLLFDYDILLFTETNLSSDINDSELGLPAYNVYRCDRNSNTSLKKSGGGVLIAVKKRFRSTFIATEFVQIEHIFVSISCGGTSNALIGCVYLPPDSAFDKYGLHCSAVEKICSTNTFCNILITGDYNLPTLSWDSAIHYEVSNAERLIIQLLSSLELYQLNKIPNHQNKILDLVMCSGEDSVVHRCDDDHAIVNIDNYHPALHISFAIISIKLLDLSYCIYDYKNCDFSNISNILSTIDWSCLFCNLTTDDSFTLFNNILIDLLRLNTPTKIIKHSNFPKWYSYELKSLIRKKKLLHRTFKGSNSNSDYLKYSSVRSQCKSLSRVCYGNFIADVERDIPLNINRFWTYVNCLRKSNSLPNNMFLNDQKATEPQTIANLFAKHFDSVYERSSSNNGDNINSVDSSGISSVPLSGLLITIEEILKKLKSLNVHKGPGPDLIPASLLRYCGNELSYPLSIILNKSLSSGIFPEVLKQSHVIPIFKSGDKSNINNYRPITIQSSIAKLFESIILDKITPSFKNIIVKQQHGFISGKSTTTNLFLLQNYILESFKNKCQVDVIYTDFSKAFDKVNHSHLIKKLSLYGFHGSLLQWFASYLTNRTQVVKLKSYISSPFSASSGVPQGSHLGPFLFNLFINDISLPLHNIDFLMFADDLKIYHRVESTIDCMFLQDKLNKVQNWCKDNSMTLNIGKCNVISFNRTSRDIPYAYSIDGVAINKCAIVKDLGVYFDQSLTFRYNIDCIVNRANRLLFFVLRHSKDFNRKTTTLLYTSLVRPILEYATVIWSPYYNSSIEQLEKVQNKFLRLLGCRLGYLYRDVPMNDLSIELNLASLETRRSKFDLIFLYKIINNMINCNELLELINFHVPCKSTRSCSLFSTPTSITNYMYNSPINRLHRIGTKVSCHIDFFSDSLSTFKTKLSNIL